jgi:hypothetical protein
MSLGERSTRFGASALHPGLRAVRTEREVDCAIRLPWQPVERVGAFGPDGCKRTITDRKRRNGSRQFPKVPVKGSVRVTLVPSRESSGVQCSARIRERDAHRHGITRHAARR